MQIDFEKLKQLAQELLVKKPVAFAYVFGSVVSGNTDSQSDLDIALGFAQGVDAEKKDLILYELQSYIARKMNISDAKIDLKIFDQMPLTLRFRVVQSGKLIFLKDILAHRVQAVNAIKMYHDEKPFFDMANKAFFARYALEKV